MKILIIEDDAILGMGLYKSLSSNGFDVTIASTGKEAESLFYQKYDFTILDLGLPDVDGIDLLKKFREKSNIPILILSARSDIIDKVKGLESGADDYMIKPFELSELLARIKSLSRRVLDFNSDIIIGKIKYNVIKNEITSDNVILSLPFREHKILEYLILNNGSIVGKEDIANRLTYNHINLSHNAIEVYIHRLRIKMKLLDVNIKTIRGIGYLINS